MFYRKAVLSVILMVILGTLIIGCGDSNTVPGGQTLTSYITAGAFYNQIDGSYVAADVTRGGTSVSNATVIVNGTPLTYGVPLTYEGVSLGTIPLYYGEVDFQPGDELTLQASYSGTPFYQGNVTVPGEVSFNQPAEGVQIIAGNNIPTTWNSTLNTLLYYLSFSPWEGTDDYEDALTQTADTVPASYVVEGEADLTVSSINGNDLDDIFSGDTEDLDEDDPDDLQTKSYWLASTYDYRDITVEGQDAKDDDVEVFLEDSSGRPTVALQLLKIDRVTIKGIRFTRRIYNAQQITSPGTAHVQVKLKKRHLAVADITVMDINQKVYYNWNHARKYKSKSKTYLKSISITPYSTVIVHTKSTDLHYANYQY